MDQIYFTTRQNEFFLMFDDLDGNFLYGVDFDWNKLKVLDFGVDKRSLYYSTMIKIRNKYGYYDE